MDMRQANNLLFRFAADRRGNIAIMAGVFATVVMGFAALGVDTGKVFIDRRKAQSATDLAALAAVSDLGNASKAAAATIARNNFSQSPVTVELGVYTASSAVAPANRFQPAAAASANAARITLQSTSSLTFGSAFLGRNSFNVTTQAVATQSAFATFAIGSRLAQVDNGLLNSLLAGLLGTNFSLSVSDYNSLLSANVDLFDFMTALATRLSLTGVSYDSLLSRNVQVTDLMNAITDTTRAAYGNSSAVSALNVIGQSLSGSTNKILLRSALDAGPYDSLSAGQKPRVSAAVSVFDLLTAFAQISNGQHQIQVPLNLNIAGIASATLALAVGERPQGTSWVTVGAAGATVNTAQTRVLLTAAVNGSGGIASVSVPIYLNLASATAQLTNVSCNFANGSLSTATLGVTPSLIDGWIGNVSATDFINFKTAVNPPAATLVSLPLLQVTGRSHVAVSNMSATPVTFSMSDIRSSTKKTVGTSGYSTSLVSSLLTGTQLGVSVAGLGIGLGTGATSSLVAGILTSATSPLDQMISTVLNTMGVGLGQADVWVTGLRCDGAVLVN
jgi:uncharacterized membrane protein